MSIDAIVRYETIEERFEPVLAGCDLRDLCMSFGMTLKDAAKFANAVVGDDIESYWGASAVSARARMKATNARTYTPPPHRLLYSGPITPRLPEREWLPLTGEIYRRDGYVCAYCGDEDTNFCIDHVVPLSRGGTNDPTNLVVACLPCNSSKSDRLLSEWRGRL